MIADNRMRGYAGDVSSADCWSALAADASAMLIDVRTEQEWVFVGVPDLRSIGKSLLKISWQTYPSMNINNGFIEAVRAAIPETDRPLYFICRSGARSRAAALAMTEAGFSHCFNVADGFEGGLDQQSHRGAANGWKTAGLPWIQN